MSKPHPVPNARATKRGAFINGIWHCDCDPRLPAEKFQTKNGGKNHGRWFYTCQKPQPKKCPFFLWSDDAKVREEAAVINNSRTEPRLTPIEPQTPKRTTPAMQPPTPFSRPRSETLSPESPRKRLWPPAEVDVQDDETFDWSSSGDEELASVAQAIAQDDKQSARKAARTQEFNSPGKRTSTDGSSLVQSSESWPFSSDGFLTPTTSTRSTGLLSPSDTQSKVPQRNSGTLRSSSSLASDVIELLKPANLTAQIEHELVDLLNRHDLRTQGIVRGRDITRVAVQAKDKKIAELQSRIAALEAEKETSRAVIAHLKQDIATSPKRPNRSRFGSRSEV